MVILQYLLQPSGYEICPVCYFVQAYYNKVTSVRNLYNKTNILLFLVNCIINMLIFARIYCRSMHSTLGFHVYFNTNVNGIWPLYLPDRTMYKYKFT